MRGTPVVAVSAGGNMIFIAENMSRHPSLKPIEINVATKDTFYLQVDIFVERSKYVEILYPS